MATERSGDRLEHLSMYRQLCSTRPEELNKESASAERWRVRRRRPVRAARLLRHEKCPVYGHFFSGSHGTEPATSGLTGRS
jgi:hypothetical protein